MICKFYPKGQQNSDKEVLGFREGLKWGFAVGDELAFLYLLGKNPVVYRGLLELHG